MHELWLFPRYRSSQAITCDDVLMSCMQLITLIMQGDKKHEPMSYWKTWCKQGRSRYTAGCSDWPDVFDSDFRLASDWLVLFH